MFHPYYTIRYISTKDSLLFNKSWIVSTLEQLTVCLFIYSSPLIVISFLIVYWHSDNDFFSSLDGQAVGLIIVLTLSSRHTWHVVTRQPCIISSNVSVNQSEFIATFVLVRQTQSSIQYFLLPFMVSWLERSFQHFSVGFVCVNEMPCPYCSTYPCRLGLKTQWYNLYIFMSV